MCKKKVYICQSLTRMRGYSAIARESAIAGKNDIHIVNEKSVYVAYAGYGNRDKPSSFKTKGIAVKEWPVNE